MVAGGEEGVLCIKQSRIAVARDPPLQTERQQSRQKLCDELNCASHQQDGPKNTGGEQETLLGWQAQKRHRNVTDNWDAGYGLPTVFETNNWNDHRDANPLGNRQDHR
jgi:hypothetical protein